MWGGEGPCHPETGQGSRGSLSCVHGRGLGELVPLLSTCGRRGARWDVSCPNNKVARLPGPGAAFGSGAVQHTAARVQPPGPRATFLPSPGCLVSNEKEVVLPVFPFKALKSCC